MSNGGYTVSAAALHAPEDFQMVEMSLPSKEVLQAIGRAVIRFGQLEHLLKLTYKRSNKNESLRSSLKRLKRGSLGGLVNGIRSSTTLEFEGLTELAKSNSRLASITHQLEQAGRLPETRNRYVHNGIGRITGGKFVFLHTGEPIEESKMCAELGQASTLAETLLLEINRRIPPTQIAE